MAKARIEKQKQKQGMSFEREASERDRDRDQPSVGYPAARGFIAQLVRGVRCGRRMGNAR
jgi:hypothetical protein